jgi:hypothetical protein
VDAVFRDFWNEGGVRWGPGGSGKRTKELRLIDGYSFYRMEFRDLECYGHPSVKAAKASPRIHQSSALVMEHAEPLQILTAQSSKRALIDKEILADSMELRVPVPNEYANFKGKTEKKCGIQCEYVAATRRLNAPGAAVSNRRTGDAK